MRENVTRRLSDLWREVITERQKKKNYIVRLVFGTVHNVNEDKINVSCSVHVRGELCIERFLYKTRKDVTC